MGPSGIDNMVDSTTVFRAGAHRTTIRELEKEANYELVSSDMIEMG